MGHNQILQSMRGIAALMVVYGHAAMLMPMQNNAAFTTEVVLFEAKSAVVFFFVLSGFVLGGSVRRLLSDGLPLWFARYAIIRIARLLPIFWLSTVLGAAICIVSARYQLSDMGPWYYMAAAKNAPTWGALVEALAKLSISFNGNLWSIRVEYWMIALLPPMVLLSPRIPVWADLVIILAGCGLARAVNPAIAGSELAWVLCYTYCFYIGVALPKIIDALGRFRPLLCSGVTAILSFAVMLRLQRLTAGAFDWGNKLILDGLLSAPLIAWAHVTRQSLGARLLTVPPLVRLGDMSYSVYAYGQCLLVLATIIVVPMLPHEMMTDPWGGAFITLLVPTASLALLLPLSWLSYVYVEQKCTRLGRRISLAIPSLPLGWKSPKLGAGIDVKSR
jgi:peptidoglycan/LPS O-acetylase OafA/YrhL